MKFFTKIFTLSQIVVFSKYDSRFFFPMNLAFV